MNVGWSLNIPMEDVYCAHWLAYACTILRRELYWRWSGSSKLDENLERTQWPESLRELFDALEDQKIQEQKRGFFEKDPGARVLSEALRLPEPAAPPLPKRTGFTQIALQWQLNLVEKLALALGTLATVDAASAAIFAGCPRADHEQGLPTLALLQWLWSSPLEVLPLRQNHKLFRSGLIEIRSRGEGFSPGWKVGWNLTPRFAEALLGISPWPQEFLKCLASDREKEKTALGSCKDLDFENANDCAESSDSKLNGICEGLCERVNLSNLPNELILSRGTQQQLDHLEISISNLIDLRKRPRGMRWLDQGFGVMFAGPPGTGKTTAAALLARNCDQRLYRLDLSQVVNKYVGETEKNLKHIFDWAEKQNVVLFFDEADALFARRGVVRTAQDRFANMEVSYLLTRIETFSGVAILATNRRADIDDAFVRRLRHVVDFQLPGAAERERLWHSFLGETGHQLESGLVRSLAQEYAFSGGHLRTVVLNSALIAHPGPLEPSHLRMAVQWELEKIGRGSDTSQKGFWNA